MYKVSGARLEKLDKTFFFSVLLLLPWTKQGKSNIVHLGKDMVSATEGSAVTHYGSRRVWL